MLDKSVSTLCFSKLLAGKCGRMVLRLAVKEPMTKTFDSGQPARTALADLNR